MAEDDWQSVGKDDWQSVSGANAGPPPKTWGETAIDVAKQIPSGIALGAQAMAHAIPSSMAAVAPLVESGLERIGLGNPKEAAELENRQRAMESIRPEVANVLPQPETLAGERARNISEFIPGAAALPGGIAARAAQAIVPGAASQAAGEITQGIAPAAEPYARFAGAVLGGVGGAKTSAAVANSIRSRAVPTVDETLNASRNLYDYGKTLQVIYPQKQIKALTSAIKEDLEDFDPEQAPTAFRNLAKLERMADASPDEIKKLGDFNPKTMERMRQNLLIDANERKPLPNGGLTSNATASRRMMGWLHDFTSNPLNGFGPDTELAPQVYQQARELWSAGQGAREIQNSMLLGEHRAAVSGTGANVENTLRQEIRKIVDNPTKASRFSAEERKTMEQILNGDTPRNSARLVGKLAATGIVSAAGAQYLAHSLGLGLMGHIAVPVVGYAAKKAGEMLTRDRINKLTQSILADSPMGRSRNIPDQIVSRAAPYARQAAIPSFVRGPTNPSPLLLQGPGAANAQENQPNVPGIPGQRKTGGRVHKKQKLTHASVHYVETFFNQKKSCDKCSMYREDGPSCTLVQSPIHPTGHCNRFDPK